MKQQLLLISALMLTVNFAFSQHKSAKMNASFTKDTTITLLAQESVTETAVPTYNIKIERSADAVRIGQKVYNNVLISLNVSEEEKYKGVSVSVRDAATGKKVYGKHFKQSYLYGFADKSIQIGIDNALLQMLLIKNNKGAWVAEIRENGIY